MTKKTTKAKTRKNAAKGKTRKTKAALPKKQLEKWLIREYSDIGPIDEEGYFIIGKCISSAHTIHRSFTDYKTGIMHLDGHWDTRLEAKQYLSRYVGQVVGGMIDKGWPLIRVSFEKQGLLVKALTDTRSDKWQKMYVIYQAS